MKALTIFAVIAALSCTAHAAEVKVEIWRDFMPTIGPRKGSGAMLAITKVEGTPLHVEVKDWKWKGEPELAGNGYWYLRGGPEIPVGEEVEVRVDVQDGDSTFVYVGKVKVKRTD